MGFPSPAKDYLEKRLDWNEIMNARYEGTIIVETADGLVVVDTSIRPRQGDTIEGEPLEEVTVIGVVTWVVTRAWDGAGPTI